jgi:tetratricopeptide (TPR) repeat protein
MACELRHWLVLPALAVLVAAGCRRGDPADEASYQRAAKMVKSQDASERATGAELLQRFPQHSRETIPALIDLLKDENFWVATYAASTLTKLTDQDFGEDIRSYKRWHRWWYVEVKQKAPKVEKVDTKKEIEKLRASVANDEGEMALAGGNAVVAVNKFMEALKLDGKVARYHSNLGLAMMHPQIRDYERALKCFEDAKAADPNYTPAYLNRGGVFSEQALDRRAVAAQHEAAMKAARAAGDIGREKAEREEMVKRLTQAEKLENDAIAEFEHAIAADKERRLWAAHAEIGRIWMRRGDFEKAVEHLEKARGINGRDVGVRRDMAITYYGLDQYWRAWKEIKAIEALGGQMDPGFTKKVEDKVRSMGGDPSKV